MMKFLALLTVLAALASQAVSQQPNRDGEKTQSRNGGAAIVYSEGGAFLIEGPSGWVVDRDAGQRIGTCCVYYPEGATFGSAEVVMYPTIATKAPGQNTLKEFMDYDLSDFREHNPEMSYEDGEDISLKNHRTAKVRYFYNVNQNSSEAVAYIDEEKMIALVVVSSRTRKGLNESIPLLRSSLQTYASMDVRFANKTKSDTGQSTQSPKN
jgi:hypothetical protein